MPVYCYVGEWGVRWGLRGWGRVEGRGLGPDIKPVLGSVGRGEGEPVIREAELKGWVVTLTGDSVGGGSGWGYGGSWSMQGGGGVDDAVGVGWGGDGDDDCGVEDEGDLWVV